MVKQTWEKPKLDVIPVDMEKIENVNELSDAELKIKLEEAGYVFSKKYQASEDYIHREVGGSDVLISVGANIADFNGYVELNKSAVLLWKKLQEPCKMDDLERVLEEKYGLKHEMAVQDVLDFINLLMEHNMVVMQ